MALGSDPRIVSKRRSPFLSRFKRISSIEYVPEIDGLRFLAIALVVLRHVAVLFAERAPFAMQSGAAGRLVKQILEHGDQGVPIFFAISGFILAIPFARQHLRAGPAVSLPAYYWRRITRLEPPYILAMVSFFAIKVLAAPASLGDLLPHLAASLVYLHNVIYASMSTITPVAWSLEVEVQFYLLAPMLAAVFALRSGIRRFVLIAAILAASLVPCALGLSKLTLLGNLQYFLVGFLVLDLRLARADAREIARRRGRGGARGAVTAARRRRRCRHARATVADPRHLLAGAALRRRLAKALPDRADHGRGRYVLFDLSAPLALISLIGRATFAIAVSQSYVANVAFQIALLLPPVLVISALYFRLVERPCMVRDWPQRLWSRLKGQLYKEASPA
jgi:peptidoglycan/LPS O-acetylase OafA/YrhL